MKTYAVDFESFYSKECSVKTLGPRAYFNHPLFDPYLVTVVGDDGFSFVGNPKEFDWTLLNGHRVLSHNASFDESLYLFGVEKGWWNICSPAEWHCTADMAAYHGVPRSLKEACAVLFQHAVDKTVRDNMNGKRWESMTPEFRESVMQYALKDSELCLALWNELSDGWPDHERRISATNRNIGRRGLPINQDLLKRNLETMRVKLFEAESSIPWSGDLTPLSRKGFNEECRKKGIEPPASLAKDSEEADAWFEKYQDSCPWARSVQSFRRINALLRKLESFDHGTLSDGRYYGGFMYYGAVPTGRFSGSGGNLNLQNLPREEMFGVNFREMIQPKPGKKLIVADLSQIEVRTLCWLANDQKTLDLIRKSDDIYHAFGVVLGMHDPANGPLREFSRDLRQRVKTITLGCGYGMGSDKFSATNNIPLDEAKVAVDTYRSRMTSVVSYWKKLDRDLGMAFQLGVPFEMELPSGRKLRYDRIKRMRASADKGFRYFGKIARFGKVRDTPLYGGLLTENVSQALARDVFCDMMLRVESAGIPIIAHVHDELVCEVPEDEADSKLAQILEIMHRPPSWIPDLPVAAEGGIHSFYTK